MNGRGIVAGLALGATALLGRPLQAEPTIWQVARDPRRLAAERLLVRVERKLLAVESASEHPALALADKREAVALLSALEPGLPEPRLRFLLGRLVAEPPYDDYGESRRLLEQALSEAPDSPLAGSALFDLGIACAKLDDVPCELGAYGRALEVVWDPNLRAEIHSNRADASMVKGDLAAAVADYRRAIALGPEVVPLTLAYYGLGVALERSGDLPGALEAMNHGTRLWPRDFLTSALDLPSVFFVPPYEIHYYKALIALGRARETQSSGSVPDQARALEASISHWHRYLEEAERARHRWVPNARAHLATEERSLKSLRALRPRRRSPPVDTDSDEPPDGAGP
jgi:tetratricopeptide (TPR) repeat protein